MMINLQQKITEIGVFPRSFELFSQHSCQVVHQSCQEPETLSVGHFFRDKLLDLIKMS